MFDPALLRRWNIRSPVIGRRRKDLTGTGGWEVGLVELEE